MASIFRPNSVGRPTSVPAKPPTKRKLLKTISSTAVPRASVAMARLMPRERTAGMAKSAPSGHRGHDAGEERERERPALDVGQPAGDQRAEPGQRELARGTAARRSR